MICHRWWCHTGIEVEIHVPEGSSPTVFSRLSRITHAVAVWEGGAMGQMLTRCGLRACPQPGLREVPGRGPVDCPECLDAT